MLEAGVVWHKRQLPGSGGSILEVLKVSHMFTTFWPWNFIETSVLAHARSMLTEPAPSWTVMRPEVQRL